MLSTALALLAAKAKTVALVAGTAAVTAGAVGGGTVALQAVSDSSDLPTTSVAAPVDAAATPTVTVGIGRQGKGKGAERRSDTATAVLTGASPSATPVTFTCDPTKNHGQNVSAFARSLPKGPGRGQQVSAVAKSDCGKTAETAETAEAAEVEATPAPKASKAPKVKASKAPKAEKAEKAAKPVKIEKAPKNKG